VKMTKERVDDIPEVHVNRDRDRYFTMLLLKVHESDSEPANKVCSKLSGMNCFSVPAHISQNHSDKASCMHQASGDKIFLSTDGLFNNCDQQKYSKYNDTSVDRHLDYSLPGDACINRKTFAYQPASGCYSKHKKSIQLQRKRHTHRNTISKTIQEVEEEHNLQLLLEFRRYLSQLVPSEKSDSVGDIADRDERLRQIDADKPKMSAMPKSLSASALGAAPQSQKKHSLPSVQTRPTDVVPSRPSSFHSVIATSGRSKPKRDYFERDTRYNIPDDVWSLQDENDTGTAGKINRFKSHSDIEIMQKVKSMHQALTHTGVLPSLGSAADLDRMSDASLFVTGNTDSKMPQLRGNNGRNAIAWLNSKTTDTQVAFANDVDCFPGSSAMPQFPIRRNPFTYKPRVPPLHVVSLATGSCLAHQPASSKSSLHGLEMFVQSLNPVVKSGSHLSHPSIGDSQSNAEANSGMLPLQGRKMKTRRAKHRIL